MTLIDRWPGTPMKQFTGWLFAVMFFSFSLLVMWFNRTIPMEMWYGLGAFALGYNTDGTFQFFAKRKTQHPVESMTVTATTPAHDPG